MAVDTLIEADKENSAIDMNISMVVEDLAEILNMTEEEILTDFLQSDTCRLLYDRDSKLWWCGPSEIADSFLKEAGFAQL